MPKPRNITVATTDYTVPEEVDINDLPPSIDFKSLEEAEENNSLKTELQSYKKSTIPQEPPLFLDLNNLCRPISTSRREIEAFFLNRYGAHSLEKLNRNAQMNPADKALWEAFVKRWPITDAEMTGAGLKYGSAGDFIKKMNFRQYWEFRNYQIQTMNGSTNEENIFLERLRLSRIEDLKTPLHELLKKSDPELSKLFELNKNLIDLIPGKDLTLEDVINYLKNMHNLYQGVTVTQNEDPNKDPNIEEAYIKYNNKTLVTIHHAENSGQHYDFKLSGDLSKEELNKAIPLMIDQVHRSKEKTNTHGIEIYGFLKNPKRALELFMLLMKNELYSITIEAATLDAWRDAANDLNNRNQKAFQQALAIYHGDQDNLGLYPLACACQKENSKDTVMQNWEKVKKHWDKNKNLFFEEQPEQSADENPTLTVPTKPPKPY